jgi:methionine salvage enolase-phosphatase E1
VEIGLRGDKLLFLSDSVGEIDAAAQAGWRTQLVDRDGQAVGAVSTFSQMAVELAP